MQWTVMHNTYGWLKGIIQVGLSWKLAMVWAWDEAVLWARAW